MRLMLVLENVDRSMLNNPAIVSVFDLTAARDVPPGYRVGMRHVIDPEETGHVTDGTVTLVWDVIDVRGLS